MTDGIAQAPSTGEFSAANSRRLFGARITDHHDLHYSNLQLPEFGPAATGRHSADRAPQLEVNSCLLPPPIQGKAPGASFDLGVACSSGLLVYQPSEALLCVLLSAIAGGAQPVGTLTVPGPRVAFCVAVSHPETQFRPQGAANP
jgi:hypothetical protein